MNFGKCLAIASLIMSLPGSLAQAQMLGSNQRAQIPPQFFYKIDIDPDQPQALPTSTPTATLPARCGPHRAFSIAWNKNSTLMAVGVSSGRFLCGRTGALRIFDMSSGIPRLLRTVHATEWLESVTFSPDGTRLVTGGDDDTVNVFEGVSPFNHLQTLTGGREIETVAINSNGTLLAAGGTDAEVRLYLKNRRNLFTHVKTLTDAGSYIVGVDFHPINGQLAVGERSHRVRIYSGISPYNRLKELFVSRGRVLAVAYNPNGTVLATADNKNEIRFYNGTDPDDNNPLQTLSVAAQILSIAFNRKGTQLLVGYRNGRVHIFEGIGSLVLSDTLPFVEPPSPPYALAFSPDGKWLSTGRDGDILMFRVDGVRAPTPTTPTSSTEAITTAIAATAVNTTAVNMTVVNTTDASTEASTKMDNSSTLKALSLITLLTAVLQDIVLQ